MEGASSVLVIRADADSQIGIGHLTRSFALGQEWKDQVGHVVLLTTADHESLLTPIRQEGFEVHPLRRAHPHPEDWETLEELLHAFPQAWVAVDGYHFDPAYHRRIREQGHPLLVIDDKGDLEEYHADVILNQNPHAASVEYPAQPQTRRLLGTRFALLRREFKAWREARKGTPNKASRLLITLGGGNILGHALRVLGALEKFEDPSLEVTFVLGATTPEAPQIEEAASNLPMPTTVVHHALDMPKIMAESDVAITGSGSTCWELAYLGVPSLLLVLAENQRPLAEWLDHHGVGVNLGSPQALAPDALMDELTNLLADPKRRQKMARRARDLVDGDGAARVVLTLTNQRIRLRNLQRGDRRLLWEWANDSEVRAAAFSPEPIPWETHVKWFRETLRGPKTFVFIALDEDDEPIGQIRFEKIKRGEAEIDVMVARDRRALGYGSLLIDQGVRAMARTTPVRTFHTFIRPDNSRSARAFTNAQFRHLGRQTVHGHEAVHYERTEPEGKDR